MWGAAATLRLSKKPRSRGIGNGGSLPITTSKGGLSGPAAIIFACAMAVGGGDWVATASVSRTTASSGRLIGTSAARAASQHVQPRSRAQRILFPKARVGEPADGLVGARRFHHGQRARTLEEPAEGEPAGAARLDQRELRHVLVRGGALDDRRHARAVDDERHVLPRLDELGERTRRISRPRAGQEVWVLLD